MVNADDRKSGPRGRLPELSDPMKSRNYYGQNHQVLIKHTSEKEFAKLTADSSGVDVELAPNPP